VFEHGSEKSPSRRSIVNDDDPERVWRHERSGAEIVGTRRMPQNTVLRIFVHSRDEAEMDIGLQIANHYAAPLVEPDEHAQEAVEVRTCS
jgi:hypothetical protein